MFQQMLEHGKCSAEQEKEAGFRGKEREQKEIQCLS